MGRLASKLWVAATILWVALPILGWLPQVAQREAQVWWWTIGSFLVLASGMSQPVLRKAGWVGVILAYGLLIWMANRITATFWFAQTALLLAGIHLIAERGNFNLLRKAVIGCAWLQIPVIFLQLIGISPWPETGLWPWGTFGHRTELGILFALSSLWTTGSQAGFWAVLSLLTGSITGAPIALLRLSWKYVNKNIIPWLCLPAFAFFTFRFWKIQVITRLEVLKDALHVIKHYWLTGWGFSPIPFGFQDDSAVGYAMRWRDTHSIFLDWITRTGIAGFFMVIASIYWLWISTRAGGSWKRWTFAFFGWVGLLQSVEAMPILALWAYVALIGIQEAKHVGSV